NFSVEDENATNDKQVFNAYGKKGFYEVNKESGCFGSAAIAMCFEPADQPVVNPNPGGNAVPQDVDPGLAPLVPEAKNGPFPAVLKAGLAVSSLHRDPADVNTPHETLQARTLWTGEITKVYKDFQGRLEQAPNSPAAKRVLEELALALEAL